AAGRAGPQGVGPCQLTFGPFQDRADAAGGCWDWRANCRVGFRILAELIDHYGESDGFARYNGSGPAADRYAADAMTRLTRWRALLAAAPQEVPMTDPCKADPASAVWQAAVRNTFGDIVSALQVLNGIEQRVADMQVELAAVK